jgi:hypothetical protein
MARVPARMSRVRSLPWLLMLRAAQLIWVHRRDDLSPQDRQRLGRLVRTPPHRFTAQERSDLGRIVRKIDLGGLTRDIAGLRGHKR